MRVLIKFKHVYDTSKSAGRNIATSEVKLNKIGPSVETVDQSV